MAKTQRLTVEVGASLGSRLSFRGFLFTMPGCLPKTCPTMFYGNKFCAPQLALTDDSLEEEPGADQRVFLMGRSRIVVLCIVGLSDFLCTLNYKCQRQVLQARTKRCVNMLT